MKVDPRLDEDGCLDIEIIENKVAWQKEKDGDNWLVQYINGGEAIRLIDKYDNDTDIVEAHQNGKSLFVKFNDGSKTAYHQDEKGNYRVLRDINHEYDKDNCIEENILDNEIIWHKEVGGDNVLLQEINNGEATKIIDRMAEDDVIEKVSFRNDILSLQTKNRQNVNYKANKYGTFKPIDTNITKAFLAKGYVK